MTLEKDVEEVFSCGISGHFSQYLHDKTKSQRCVFSMFFFGFHLPLKRLCLFVCHGIQTCFQPLPLSAVAPVSSWLLYDSIYTERYMATCVIIILRLINNLPCTFIRRESVSVLHPCSLVS